ncbi:uncharacterized protein LOC129567583 isoform X2 [Sitodiplosis mosellana]|nr:uncharacterized protein LOC129567583 isoform X2 [Sitodiplosis mosellana]XP_055300628.1 uncharacterized protein LOC129567583 isoform X2 [Sitodiplosis mosellana]
MSAGKENENKRNENSLRSNPMREVDASKVVVKPLKRPIPNKSTHAPNATIKTKSNTATATKITKLVLKPKPVASKSSLTSKVTSQKYITKPVAIKSRSTMISHESTFRIRNIRKVSPPSERQKGKSEVIVVNSSKISQQLTVSGNNSKINDTIVVNQPFEMVHSEHSANITSLNVTKIVSSPILQEITSTVVNGSNLTKSSVHEIETKVPENVKSLKKIANHCENEVKSKPKSYDPIKARQFIRMQKEKRKEIEKEKSKTPATKEEIKQRLSALRSNTLKIVGKNVQKARKSVNTNPGNSKSFTPKTMKKPPQSNIQKQKETKPTSSVLQTPQQLRLQSKISPSLALTPSKFLPSIKSDKNRIGILRRPEGVSPTIESTDTHIVQTLSDGSANVEQHSESNIDPNISLEKSIHNSTFRSEPRLCEFELKVPETVPLKSSLLHEISNNGVQDEVQHDNRDNEQHFEDTVAKPRDIPYWLRPTPVQPYPYNFIMAVRKKLESITHPVVSLKPRQWPNPTEHASLHSPLARPNTMFESHFRRNLERRQSESSENVQSSDVSPRKSSNHIENSPDQEEYSMDFSSVVFESKRDRSNAVSKSKRKSVSGSQDTLSISSGILSHSSPEKKMRSKTTNGTGFEKDDKAWQPSPLTTDNVDGLHITSRSLSQNERISNANSVVSHKSAASSATSHINFGRGKHYSGRGLPTFDQLSDQQSLAQLLDDFKSSLSQAIEANQQLRDLLSNPPSSRQPSSRFSQYSDDFEHTSENKQSDISECITGPNDLSSKSKYNESTLQTNGQLTVDKNSSVNETDRVEVSHSNVSTATNVIENYSNITTNVSTSKQNYSEKTVSNDFEESQEKEEEEEEEAESTRVPKESSTLIEEKIDDYQSSESPTNNDLKSVSLSIAKMSAPTTSDDTDQPSNAIESFSKQIIGDADVANESIGSDIFNIFNKTTGVSLMEDVNQSIWSEHNISYSTLGMCDQLLKSETRKSEDLASLLKIREKSLIDRFKGQIAWLELQKQKFKENGLTSEISMIKKKQRALLLRLNNDRKELHRVLKERQQSENAMRNSSIVNFNISHMSTNMSIRKTSISKQSDSTSAKRALKAIELPGGGVALETMLQKRENELRRRREHVEKLLRWHQRLDVEEREVIKMEQMIMYISTSDVYQTTTSHEQINDTLAITVQRNSKRTNCQRNEISVHERSLTNVSDLVTMEKTRFEHRKQKQIHKIEKSLNTLKLISSQSISSDIDGSTVDDVVEIFGRQLNKLWKRLTGEYEKKYTPDKVYKLSKSDLELLYEQAKCVVLKQFHKNDEFKRRLIDNSMSIIDESQRHSISTPQLAVNETNIEKKSSEQEMPTLNLVSSPEPRENVISDTDQGYYFSNNSNNEEISEQQKQTKTDAQSVEASTLDGTSENLESSQIRTEQTVEEDEQSESIQDEVQSDITEDSLNKPKTTSSEDVSPSHIKTISHANESRVNESGASSQIPSAIETSHTTVPFELNISENHTQLIEETSFPNIDIQTTVSSVIESDLSMVSKSSVSPVKKSTSNISSRPSDEQKYQSNDFEDGKSADELTSISTATITKIATTITTPTTINQSTEQTVTPQTESPKELEQRLILIDDGLKELHEIISHSPVLQTERESGNGSEGIESEKSTGTKSPLSDNELKADDDENKSTESGKSEENSETNNEKTVEHDTPSESTVTEPSVETNETPKIDSDESTDSIAAEIAASKIDTHTSAESMAQKRPYQYTLSAGSIDYNKVPEADALKRSQIPSENEMKATEQPSVMFPFLREIPNKPPPPYPVHRQLPITPPFPCDDRIKEIVNRRVEELYMKLNSTQSPETPVRSDATFVKSPSLSITSPQSPAVQEETNVFERIILASCEEIMQEISVPEQQLAADFRLPLEFYNPPDRLKCFQQHTIKRIFKLLNRSSDASNGSVGDGDAKLYTGLRSFLPSQVAQLTFNNRRKRDAVDEILIQELYEDEARWTNFDLEEKEIRDSVTDLKTLLADDSSGAHETSINATNTE